MNDWKEVFRKFYNDNEAGGSSRWLVTPMTVEVFIKGLLMETKPKGTYQLGKRLLEEIMSGVYGTKNRSQLILRMHELLSSITQEVEDQMKFRDGMKKGFKE